MNEPWLANWVGFDLTDAELFMLLEWGVEIRKSHNALALSVEEEQLIGKLRKERSRRKRMAAALYGARKHLREAAPKPREKKKRGKA